ncbi:atherin-like protein [Leptotrombidium deliense]|uniref:Atherin-like protein n=1 Tax=Leptotrombidium deliense TaxID=299467 RepID=A0A443S1B0_9ACAR|nr:atherin-like protein [Leptotrombidium deliense]
MGSMFLASDHTLHIGIHLSRQAKGLLRVKNKLNREANGVHFQAKFSRRGVKKESMCSSVTIEMNGLDDDDDDNVICLCDSSGDRSERDSVDWTIDDVADFIRDSGFPDEALLFKQQEIDGRSLLLLQRTDVLTGLSMKLGPALKIFARIYQLQMTRFQSLCSDQSSNESGSFAANNKSDTQKLYTKLPELIEYQKCRSSNF